MFIRYVLGKPPPLLFYFLCAIDEGKKKRIAGKVAWKKEHEEEKTERN